MSDHVKGILLTLGSVVFFALMAVLVKAIPNVSSYQTTFFRFAIGLGIIGILSLFGIIQLKFNDKKTPTITNNITYTHFATLAVYVMLPLN